VDLAHHSTIAVLLHWFPDCLDKLQREHSAISGDTPMLLVPQRDGEADLLGMLFGKRGPADAADDTDNDDGVTGDNAAAEAGHIQFGAHQAILVYSEKQQKRVQSIVGDNALVLTVQQCKGLEFEVREASRE
jgi:hypothetical protein